MLLLVLLLADGFKEPLIPRRDIEFDRMTVAEARRLSGQVISCRIVLASSPLESGKWVCYEGRTFAEVQRTVFLLAEPESETVPLTVRGRLRVIQHQPRTIDGM